MSLSADLRSAVRSLRRQPATPMLAVLTLALGLGASTAIFSAIRGILLQPLPYGSPGAIVRVVPVNDDPNAKQVSWPNFEDLRTGAPSLEAVAGYGVGGTFVYEGGEAELFTGCEATHDLFAVLRVAPLLGRPFTAEDDRAGAAPVGLLSWDAWQTKFGGDPNVVGRSLPVSPDGSERVTVIGVMPRGFRFPIGADEIDYYAPLGPQVSENDRTGRDRVWLDMVARVREGVSIETARAEVSALANRLANQYPAANRGLRLRTLPLLEETIGSTGRALWILLAAVGTVLLIGCANVANLLLSRGTSRTRELAVRAALGASRVRIARQLLTESLLIGLAAGLAGMALAAAGIRIFRAIAPPDLPRIESVVVDWRVFAFGLTLSLATALLFGLAPALLGARGNVTESLRDGSRGSTEGRRRGRLREALVVAEIGLALLLLPAAGLLLRSFWNLTSLEQGFDARNVTMIDFSLRSSRWSGDAELQAAHRQYRERFEALPGVEAVGTTNMLPFHYSWWVQSFTVEGAPRPEPGAEPNANYVVISPGYLDAVKIRQLRGRRFTESDGPNTTPVAIVSESFARLHLGEGDPIGRRVRMGESLVREVVGVVADVREEDLTRDPQPALYVPWAQAIGRRQRFLVRTSPGITGIEESLRGVVRELDPLQPVIAVKKIEEIRAESLAGRKLALALVLSLAVLAFVLAAVGIYSVMSYSVAQRRSEIGVRMAFGARPGDIRTLILGRVGRLMALGGAIGLIAALAASRILVSFLYGIDAADPSTYAVMIAMLGGVALAAGWIPARRAGRVDPLVAIRDE